MAIDIAAIRREYSQRRLKRRSVNKDPIMQFRQWFDDALMADVNEPNAMTLATAGGDGKPSARIVLLKDITSDGLTFFTNYESRKGRQLTDNPHSALVFFWPELERQVRLEGVSKKLDPQESNTYFNTRPRGSCIGAWASRQSTVIPSRKFLEGEVSKYSMRFINQDIPRPSFWGGYKLVPDMIEFWQGQPDRLHDRIQYVRISNRWNISRLSP